MVGCSFLPSVVFHSPLGQGDSLIILKALGSTSNQSCSNVSWEMRITGLRPGVSSKQECKVNPDYWLNLTIYYYPGRAAGETCWPLEQNQKDKHLNLLVSHNINNSEYSMPHFRNISKKKKKKNIFASLPMKDKKCTTNTQVRCWNEGYHLTCLIIFYYNF